MNTFTIEITVTADDGSFQYNAESKTIDGAIQELGKIGRKVENDKLNQPLEE